MKTKKSIPILGLGTWRIGGHKGVNMDNEQCSKTVNNGCFSILTIKKIYKLYAHS